MEILIKGIVFLLLGFGLRYWINRRKFNRRNVAGLEGFSNYEKATFINFIERIGKWLAYAVILIGLMYVWMYYKHTNSRERDKRDHSVTVINIIDDNKSFALINLHIC